MKPRHQKVTAYDKLDDGAVKITTKSYYEELTDLMEEIEKNIITDFNTLKRDVDIAVEQHFIKDGSKRLVLTLELKGGKPKLVKRWIVVKESFRHR
jgi:hypothetical protein